MNHIQTLDARRLLSASFDASLADGTLSVTSTFGREAVFVNSGVQTLDDSVREVDDGVTSVGLDFATLEAAASLALAGVDNTVPPAAGPFAVGFDITEASDFRYVTDGTLLGGTIAHSGTVTFDVVGTQDQVTVGDFDIGFDAARAVDGNSGLFVADTFSGLGILFDVGAPDSLAVDGTSLTAGRADLNVSPEFAGFLLGAGLASADLTGATVGDARVDALAVQEIESVFVTRFAPFQAPQRFAFDAAQVENLSIDTGRGADTVVVSRVAVDDLTIDTGNGRDRVSVFASDIAGDTLVDLGRGRDRLVLLGNAFEGSATFDGGRGFDVLFSIGNSFDEEPDVKSMRDFRFGFGH
jgi:hypothetical protein